MFYPEVSPCRRCSAPIEALYLTIGSRNECENCHVLARYESWPNSRSKVGDHDPGYPLITEIKVEPKKSKRETNPNAEFESLFE